MKHQREILGQRLANMKSGVERAEGHVESIKNEVSNILNLVKDDNSVDNLVKEITSNLDELADFIRWIKEQ